MNHRSPSAVGGSVLCGLALTGGWSEAFQDWLRPRWRVAVGLQHAAIGGTQHELGVSIVDRVVIDIKAVDFGGDRRCVRDRATPPIDNLADRNLVPTLKHPASD